MTLGSPTSPKPTSGAQFLPGFLMGDLPAPASPQPRPFSLNSPIADSMSASRAPQPVVPTPKDKSGAPPVRSIYDDLVTTGTPLSAHKQVGIQPGMYLLYPVGLYNLIECQFQLSLRFGLGCIIIPSPHFSQSVMGTSDVVSPPLSVSSSALPSTPRSAIRPLSASYRGSSSDYQVTSGLHLTFSAFRPVIICFRLNSSVHLSMLRW
ncbi:hypothetical protein GOODEAATRI_010522 [Goodea atripinnis]|uniref:Uncharacterized protein n=1 Tax=Goodea atripinnis TaxID=208336 RepID=A0ABV0N0E0_9TELE